MMARRLVRPPPRAALSQLTTDREWGADLKSVSDGPVEGDHNLPYCQCFARHKDGFSFDPDIGVWVHAAPDCWKPSKAYYESALRAGIFPTPIAQKGV